MPGPILLWSASNAINAKQKHQLRRHSTVLLERVVLTVEPVQIPPNEMKLDWFGRELEGHIFFNFYY